MSTKCPMVQEFWQDFEEKYTLEHMQGDRHLALIYIRTAADGAGAEHLFGRSLNFPWQAPEVLTKRWCNMIQDRTSFCTFAPMKKEPTTINKDFIISFFLPDGMTDWFEIVGMREEPNGGTAQADVLYSSVLHIYLDERDNRIGDQLGLKPNGFTEATVIKDYPIRNRKVLLHVRRRRYLDADGRNIILNQYPLTADGTKLSVEFGLFFKDGDGQPSVDGSVIGKILSY